MLVTRSSITARHSWLRNGNAATMLRRKVAGLLKQVVDSPLVAELNCRRHASPLPVIDALLVSGLAGQPEQPGKLSIPSSSSNDHLGIGRIHRQD